MLAAMNNRVQVTKTLIEIGADLNEVNWKDNQRSALDYAIKEGHYQIASLLRNNKASNGLEAAKYPARPAAKSGYIRCNTRCSNGDCYRTYSDGRKVRFQAERKYNPFNSQWEWDSGSC